MLSLETQLEQHTYLCSIQKKRVSTSKLPEILEQLSSLYKTNPTIEFINSGIESINSHDYVVLEFIPDAFRLAKLRGTN